MALAFFTFVSAEAYETALSPEVVREAYFLGQRRDEKTTAFLLQYVQRFPPPKTGPHVSQIELLTPYAFLVQTSRNRSMEYSAQQAEQDYHKLENTIRVHISIRFTPTYGFQVTGPSRGETTGNPGIKVHGEDFWRDFTFQFTQEQSGDGKPLAPFDMWGEPYYSKTRFGSALGGADVWLLLDAANVTSDPIKIDVATPDGQHIPVVFDLSKLR